jgi:hypothetical protein
MKNGVPIDQAIQDERSGHPGNLATINIEAVNARWVDDVGKFLKAADAQVYKEFNENIAGVMKPDEVERDEGKDRLRPKGLGSEGGAWIIEVRAFTYHKSPTFVRDCVIRNLQRIDTFIKDDKKVDEFLPGVDDPVKGAVSRAFVYHQWAINVADDTSGGAPTNLGVSYLDQLLVSSGSSSSGSGDGGGFTGPIGRGSAPPTSAPAGPGPGASGGADVGQLAVPWIPLIGSGSGGGGLGGPAGSAFAAGGFSPRGGGPGLGAGVNVGPGPGPGAATPTTPAPTTEAGKSGDQRRRTEFVIMFVWKEPLPTVGPEAK